MAGLNVLNYEVVPKFIDSDRAIKLGNEFREYVETHCLPGDDQVERSRSMYDYVSFLELLVEKSNQVTNICGQRVLPTYCYARTYYYGADLKRHTDRPACEVSVTLNLGSDQDWPIYVKTPEGEEVSVTLKPGDAMLYYGCETEHWREVFTGEYCNQVFLHYVKSRGDNQPFYFDKMR